MIRIPVRCEGCKRMAHLTRLVWAWITVCNGCFKVVLVHDTFKPVSGR